MLEAIIIILIVLWLLGFSLNVAGGLVHILLVVALVLVIVRLIQGRRVV